jgi:flagellin-specific chaperone FliS
MLAYSRQPSQRYRELQIESASPLQRILMVYDVAIVACQQRDLKRMTDALNVLRNSLDLEQGEVAAGLYRLYQYCADLARQDQYEEAEHILRELTEAWVQVLVREKDILQARPVAPAVDSAAYISVAG